MNEAFLHRLIRRAVLTALASSAASAVTACGGISSTEIGESTLPDGAPRPDSGSSGDAAADAPFDASCIEKPTRVPDGGLGCAYLVSLKCGIPPIDAGGGLPAGFCDRVCGDESPSSGCSIYSSSPATVQCFTCVEGRRPAGLCGERTTRGGSIVGDYFARAAFLEAASIDAFHVLRDELTAHGAPPELVREAERAAADEVRHARSMGALAARFGGSVQPAVVERREVRPLEDLAIENAIEGCVRETFGAVTAAFQAERSRDPKVRAVMKRVAKDEARHAALAWSVARWAHEKLGTEERARVRAAQEAAVNELLASAAPIPRELTDVAGLPDDEASKHLLAQLANELWKQLS